MVIVEFLKKPGSRTRAVSQKGSTGIPHFSQACFPPLFFYVRPILVPVTANQQRGLLLLRKKAKIEISVQCLLCREPLQRKLLP